MKALRALVKRPEEKRAVSWIILFYDQAEDGVGGNTQNPEGGDKPCDSRRAFVNLVCLGCEL